MSTGLPSGVAVVWGAVAKSEYHEHAVIGMPASDEVWIGPRARSKSNPADESSMQAGGGGILLPREDAEALAVLMLSNASTEALAAALATREDAEALAAQILIEIPGE